MVRAPDSPPRAPPPDHEPPPDYRPSTRSRSRSRPPPGTDSRNASVLGTEHSYALEHKGRAWITLKVKSRAGEGKGLPLFVDGDKIEGVVQLDLDKTESMKGISIAVTAGTTAVGQEEERFLEVAHDLAQAHKFKGSHAFPFCIVLPAECTPKGETKAWPLPPTMSERASPAYIDYKLTVTVKRGALRVNQAVGTSFFYLPRSRPDPPSLLRQAAYREDIPLVGPSKDPDGWKVLPSLTIMGTVFETRPVEVECTLAIATPLAYSTGSPIPLHLTLRGTDAQALDLFSTPGSIQLVLMRTLAIGSGATQAFDNEGVERRSNNTFLEPVGAARWWAAPPPDPETRGEKRRVFVEERGGRMTRVVVGELEVRKGLRPSFAFPRYCLSYTLALRAFNVPGFVVASSSAPAEFLLAERVRVTTSAAPGPAPRSRAPPGYEAADARGDYTRSLGLLENGNQRFIHHSGAGWSMG